LGMVAHRSQADSTTHWVREWHRVIRENDFQD
jgi:hypothetical protein